jgi:hypothetical protein
VYLNIYHYLQGSDNNKSNQQRLIFVMPHRFAARNFAQWRRSNFTRSCAPDSDIAQERCWGPTVQALKLSKELTMKLRTHAREVGATVHGALVAAFTFAGRRLSSNWLTHPVLVVSPVNNRKLLGLEDQCALSIIFPTGAYAPDSEERLWDVARAVKDELTPVRTAQELSTVFSAFRQLMSTSPDVAHIAAFELQVCACEGTAITAAALNATATWRSPPEVDRCRHGYGSTRGICSILAGGEQCRRPPIFRPA